MKSVKKLTSTLLLLILSISILAGCAGGSNEGGGSNAGGGSNEGGGEKLVLKIANITKADSEWSLTAEAIGKELSDRTDGRITAEYYPGGQLGNETDMMQQLNTGSIDMAIITTAQLSASSPAFGAWLMPFVVDTHDQAYKLWTSDVSMGLFDTLTNENVKGLGYVSSGFRFMLATKPIDEPADLDGFKLRTTPSPTILDYWNALKASPTPMPLTEVYTALQTGVIDGVDIDSISIISENLTEIAKNMTPDKHMYWAGGLMMNKDLWNRLSDEDKALIQEVVTKQTEENSKRVAAKEKELLENGEKTYGIEILQLKNPADFDPYVKQVQDAWVAKAPVIGDFLKKAEEIRAK